MVSFPAIPFFSDLFFRLSFFVLGGFFFPLTSPCSGTPSLYVNPPKKVRHQLPASPSLIKRLPLPTLLPPLSKTLPLPLVTVLNRATFPYTGPSFLVAYSLLSLFLSIAFLPHLSLRAFFSFLDTPFLPLSQNFCPQSFLPPPPRHDSTFPR